MSLEEAVKFRTLVKKANDKYQALLKIYHNQPQQIEVIACDKESSSEVLKKDSINESEEFPELELQQEFGDKHIKNEPIEDFQEIDIQHFLNQNSQSSIATSNPLPLTTSADKNSHKKSIKAHKSDEKFLKNLEAKFDYASKRPEITFVCNQCGAIFQNFAKKQEHVIAVHKNSRKQSHKTFGCSQCSEKFFNDFERQDHVLKCHGKKSRKESHKTFYCIQCDEKFCSDFERLEHIGKIKFYLYIQGTTILYWAFLDKVHKITRKRLHRKPTPEGFSTPQTEYVCAYCGLYFINKFDCYVHRRRLHEEEESTLQCPHCNKFYPTLTLLRSHIKTIHSEKQFMCSKCGKTFANKSFYDLHIKKENNQKDYVSRKIFHFFNLIF